MADVSRRLFLRHLRGTPTTWVRHSTGGRVRRVQPAAQHAQAFSALASDAQAFAALAQNAQAFSAMAQNAQAMSAMARDAQAFSALARDAQAFDAMARSADAFSAQARSSAGRKLAAYVAPGSNARSSTVTNARVSILRSGNGSAHPRSARENRWLCSHVVPVL